MNTTKYFALPKTKIPKTVADFRPVSVTPSLAGVFKKLLFICLNKPVDSNKKTKTSLGSKNGFNIQRTDRIEKLLNVNGEYWV